MIGLHRTTEGGHYMRRDEKPLRRVNPSGEVRWVARYTNHVGARKSAGTYARKGPCRAPGVNCCAQHAIWAAYEADAPSEPTAQTVDSYYATWFDRYPRNPRTAANYRGRLGAVLDVTIEGVPFREWRLRDLKRSHMARLVDVMLREHGRAASGTRAVISVLSAMFEDANDDGEMDFNPAHGVRVRATDPRVQKPKRTITVASWAQMHDFARATGEYEPMVRTLADCGLRLGEMLGLERSHFRGTELHVCQTGWHGTITRGTKQGPGRIVPVPPALQAMLEALPARLGTRLLFPDPKGRVWHERSFYRVVWYPAQQATGLMIRPHDMRHSYVSLQRAAGIDPSDLALVSGHSEMTATRTYTHSVGWTFDKIREAVG